jgi:glycosyltransferase involved in cell wall biosynthesis
LVWDDCSPDDTKERVLAIHDNRIIYHRNEKRLGYGRNLQACSKEASGEIVFLMADDDLLLKDALQRTHDGFLKGDHIGAVTRPYYSFWDDPRVPIRAVFPFNPHKDSEISIFDGKKAVWAIFQSAGQLSGLAFRRRYMDCSFHSDTYVAQVYPLASILRRYKALFLKDFTVATRLLTSMSTRRAEIYDISPLESWVRMFKSIYQDREYEKVREECIDVIVRGNYAGLFQIKTTTASARPVLREMRITLSNRPRSALDADFYLFSVISILTPAGLLRKALDWYKVNLLSRQVGKMMQLNSGHS